MSIPGKTAFREEKATQVCAFYLDQAKNSQMPYVKALKMLYCFERRMLRLTGYPSIGDEIQVMKEHGPVLINTLHLMIEDPATRKGSVWHRHIQTERFDLKLVEACEFDLISDAEKEILNALVRKYGRLGKWEIVKIADEIPEDAKITRGKAPLSAVDILVKLGHTVEGAKALERKINEAFW